MTGKKIILAGWVIDGTGGPVLENVFLHLENGFFKEVSSFEGGAPESSAYLDLSGHTLLPGLVDAHVHLFMSGTDDENRRKQQLKEGFHSAKGTISRHLRQLLAHGVLAVRDGGDKEGYALRYKKDRMEEKDPSICLHVAGKAWHKSGRYGSFVGHALQGGSLGEGILRESGGLDHVKIIQSGLNSLKDFGKETPPQFNLEALRHAVEAASDLGLKTMVHANGKTPVQIALEAGCASIEHGFFMGKQNLERMAEGAVFWVPTAYTMKAYAEYGIARGGESRVAIRNLDHQLEQMAMARRLGVKIALGTDAGSTGVHHGSAVVEELELLLTAGFTIEGAIKCASFNGARLLGLEQKGLIKKGMRADFVAVKGGPEGLPDSLKRVARVHSGGRFL